MRPDWEEEPQPEMAGVESSSRIARHEGFRSNLAAISMRSFDILGFRFDRPLLGFPVKIAFRSRPSLFACEQMKAENIDNVTYLRADTNALPFSSGSVDHAVGMWGAVDTGEAERVVRPGGRVFLGGCAPGNVIGELSPIVGSLYGISKDSPMAELFFADSGPDHGVDEKGYGWSDFDYVAEYRTPEEAARLYGRIYGPQVGDYLKEQGKSAIRWRLRLLSRQVEP